MEFDDFANHGPVIVCPASQVGSFVFSVSKSPLIKSILSISSPLGCSDYARPNLGQRHGNMALTFEDDIDDAISGPQAKDIEQILAWGRQHHQYFDNNTFPESKVLIHCFAGYSRSSAAAVICFAQAMPEAEEGWAYICAEESNLKKTMGPNIRMLYMADLFLQREGRLLLAAQPWVGQSHMEQYNYYLQQLEVSGAA